MAEDATSTVFLEAWRSRERAVVLDDAATGRRRPHRQGGLTDDMWVVQYLFKHPLDNAWTEPVKVAVSLDDGTVTAYELHELDLCAQVNHGC